MSVDWNDLAQDMNRRRTMVGVGMKMREILH